MTDEENRTEFTEEVNETGEGVHSEETSDPGGSSGQPQPKFSDIILGLTAAGTFRITGQPEGAPQPTPDQAAQVFYAETRRILDSIDFDEYLNTALAEASGGEMSLSPWWIVGLGVSMVAFNAWSYSRMLPKKTKADKKTAEKEETDK